MLLLHEELAAIVNYWVSVAALVGFFVLISWAVDLLIIRLKRGKTAELRRLYVHIANLSLPLGFVAALFGLMMSLFYSEYIGYIPCFLCWLSRILMYPLVVLFGIAWLVKDFKVYRYTAVLSMLGMVLSLYHHAIQMGYDPLIPCGSAGPFVDCAVPSFVQFGFVTFPFLGFVMFLFFFLLSLTMRMHHKQSVR